MARKAVIDAVMAHLSANFDALPIREQNSDADAPFGGESFVTVQFPVARNSRMTHSRTFREWGGIRIVIVVPRGSGVSHAVVLAEEIATLFREVSIGPGLHMRTPESPILDDDNEDGAYYGVAVSIPYDFFYEA